MAATGRKKGFKHSEETRKKMSLKKIGYKPWNTGKTNVYSPEILLKMSIGRKKSPIRYWLGKKRPEMTGEKNWRWISDRTKVVNYSTERNNPEYKQWKNRVFSRDNHCCRIYNSDCNGRIEAHHILSWKEYPELRYQTNNGITLCHAHHPRKRAEEKRLSPYFMELMSVSKE